MVSTAAFHARVRSSVPGLRGLKESPIHFILFLQTVHRTQILLFLTIKIHHYILRFVRPLHSKPGMESYC